MQYLKRNLKSIKCLLTVSDKDALNAKERHDLMVINEVYRQQSLLYRAKTHSIPGKIVSIAQPHIRPIARGKARAAFEFGAKISASITEHGMLYIDRMQWEPYNEGEDLPMQAEKYKQRFGRYPASIHADKIYRTRDNRLFCSEHGIRLSGPHLGRPPLKTPENARALRAIRRIERSDEAIRQAIEGGFGRLKRKMTLANVYEKLKATSEVTIMVCFFLANCEKILRDLFVSFLELLELTLEFLKDRANAAPMGILLCQLGWKSC